MTDGDVGAEARDRVAAALEVARIGGTFALDRFHSRLPVEVKADGTPVTVADRGAESAMRERIARLAPHDAVLGEEHTDEAGTSGWTWVLDPIDGTKSFVRGVPLWSTLVGILHEGRPVVGVLSLPALGEILDACTGGGCRWNGQPTGVSETASLGDALLCQSDLWGEHAGMRRLARSVAVGRTWGDAYGYYLVATGRAELMVDPEVSLWDVAAIQPIVEEAGGRFTDLEGRARPDGGSGIGSNGRLHVAALEVLRSGPG